MPTFFVALLIGAVVLAFIVVAAYNNLVLMRQNVRESWSAIETELRRRYDLIPNLVETVKGYAGHERETLEAVIKARNAAVTQGPIDQQVASQNMLTGALGKLMALSEAYPQLQANANFSSLQNELNETETRISQARRFYNANVKEFNTACETFPSAIVANSFGFKSQPYFGIDESKAYEPVAVNFGSAPKAEAQPATMKIPQSEKEQS